MGAAEVGRELGDAGGPLFVGTVAAAITLAPAMLTLAGLLVALTGVLALPRNQPPVSNAGESGAVD